MMLGGNVEDLSVPTVLFLFNRRLSAPSGTESDPFLVTSLLPSSGRAALSLPFLVVLRFCYSLPYYFVECLGSACEILILYSGNCVIGYFLGCVYERPPGCCLLRSAVLCADVVSVFPVSACLAVACLIVSSLISPYPIPCAL